MIIFHFRETTQPTHILANTAAPPNKAPMATPTVWRGAAAVRKIEERASLLMELALEAIELVKRPISEVMLERSLPVAVPSFDVRLLSCELPCE